MRTTPRRPSHPDEHRALLALLAVPEQWRRRGDVRRALMAALPDVYAQDFLRGVLDYLREQGALERYLVRDDGKWHEVIHVQPGRWRHALGLDDIPVLDLEPCPISNRNNRKEHDHGPTEGRPGQTDA
jgi:hypothetical protein